MTAPQFSWWKHGLIYQIYPRSFMDSNGDGIGDFNGLISKLDYLQKLGFDGIWLSPFYPSPMKDFGYNVSDYCDIDPVFGDLAIFDTLVRELHARNLKLLIDWVPNHTSDQHPWFIESRSSRDNPKRDWYLWHDAKPDGSVPNNWPCAFGGSPWEWDAHTDQYYLHSFLPEQPDLNWRNPEVVAAMHSVMRFWLDRGVDGFRINVPFYMIKDAQFRDNVALPTPILNELSDYTVWSEVYDQHQPEVHEVLRGFRTVLDGYADRAMVGEVWASTRREWASYLGNGSDELHMAFYFFFLRAPWDVLRFKQLTDGLNEVVPENGHAAIPFSSHDDPRAISRWGVANARSLALLQLTLPGTPFVYYGEEIGMRQVPITIEQMQDPVAIRRGDVRFGRDGNRTPMQWSSEPGAGFTRGTPWLPFGEEYAQINVETEQAEPDSLLHFYERLIAFRKTIPALYAGKLRTLDGMPASILGYVRTLDAERCWMFVNFGDQTVHIPLESARVDHARPQRILFSTVTRSEDASENVLTLAPHESCIMAD